MALSSPNEPTEGTGGSLVIDTLGEAVGTVVNIPVPSEDVARVAIELDPDTRARHDLQVSVIDVEAAWLHLDPQDHSRLILDRPLDEALQEQGFDVAPEVPGREPVFGGPGREPL